MTRVVDMAELLVGLLPSISREDSEEWWRVGTWLHMRLRQLHAVLVSSALKTALRSGV